MNPLPNEATATPEFAKSPSKREGYLPAPRHIEPHEVFMWRVTSMLIAGVHLLSPRNVAYRYYERTSVSVTRSAVEKRIQYALDADLIRVSSVAAGTRPQDYTRGRNHKAWESAPAVDAREWETSFHAKEQLTHAHIAQRGLR